MLRVGGSDGYTGWAQRIFKAVKLLWLITLIVDTFVQVHRMYNIKSEPSCKVGTLGANDVSVVDTCRCAVVTNAPLWWGILIMRKVIQKTKFCILKAMVFPIVKYGYESWTIKKAECWKIDAFELWYWVRLVRVPCGLQGDQISPS